MNKHKGSLVIGIALIAVGILFVAVPSGKVFVSLLIRFWPLLLVLFGLVRIAGFLYRGCPRSPIAGALIVGMGALFLISNFTTGNPFQAYGRFWPFLLVAFALGELIFQYSRRGVGVIPPPVITLGKVFVVISLIVTGTLSARIARTNPNFFSASMPEAFGQFRDAIFGREFTFVGESQTTPFIPNSKVVIENSYGDIDVRTSADSQMSVTLNKAVRAYNEASATEINNKVKLSVTKGDGSYTIGTNRDDVRSNMKTNLIVKIPQNVVLRIENRSGRVTVSGLNGNQNITNSRGAVEITDVNGQITVSNDFSRTIVRRVTGLNLESRHGTVDASDITGNVEINSQFDKVSARNIGGSIKVLNVHGNINLANITGIVTTEAEQTDVTARDLKAGASITSSHCHINLSTVAGDIVIQAPHADIDAADIKGALTVQDDSHGSIHARRIGGALTFNGSNSDVVASDITGAIVVQTSHAKVQLTDFSSTVNCATSNERVTITTAKALAGNIEVENDRGEIRLNVPISASFQLNANARHGRIVSQGLNTTLASDKESAFGQVGPGGPDVRLATSYGNIIVKATNISEPVANTND